MSLPDGGLVCFPGKFFVAYVQLPIDIVRKLVYNIVITLSRAAEETGPVKPGNLTVITDKVLNPAVYPKDEEFYQKRSASE